MARLRSLFASCFLFGAASVASACQDVTVATITTDTTWGPGSATNDTCYVVNPTGSSLTISSGATLTILPGTTVKFSAGKSLVVGSTGSVRAAGSYAAPIVFTSSSGTRGGWGGIRVAVGSTLTT